MDSFALLAYLEEESDGARVEGLLRACKDGACRAWLSIVNFGEILYITERERGLTEALKVVAIIDQLPVTVAEANRSRTFAAAHVKARSSLSYADAIATALAREVEAHVVTGDPEFEAVEGIVPVLWLGKTGSSVEPRSEE